MRGKNRQIFIKIMLDKAINKTQKWLIGRKGDIIHW